MDRTHETMLTDVLRDVYTFGSARVAWHHWYRWLGIERMTKNKWREVQGRWETLLDDVNDQDGWRLGYVDNDRADFLTLVCLDPDDAAERLLKPISKKFES